MYVMRVEKFRPNESVFVLISDATRVVRPKVLESVYREQWMKLPTGFVRLHRYVIFDVLAYVSMV